ncbi:TonB-dependent receptor [Alkalimonas sp. MEB108]|uniref:TonB-dependent receptor n=1 Tax=Alkalimonas cellulosilytica TaxID=3058395 RepID=A0ABU7J5T7_9GAMM|nr:TonB-dependent receptor [Alkalimonas sp. MEB108]MEE2001868.1 TonB-dependent receptor [Alkalimonas sp. MEB108]
MSSNKLNKCALAVKLGLMVGAFGLSMPAMANDGATEDNVEVIQVRGIRASQEANLNAKRFANAVVDVVTAEDVGKFPDKNVAESLSRITGVGVSREFGEGEKITIRGASSATNRTLLNGQTIATADWFILDAPGRSFNYTMLPSALVSDLEVYKSPMARIDEGSIGGTVILRTRRPLNLEANTLNLGVEMQYTETSKNWDPQLSGLYSWKNDDETFGVLISAMRQDRDFVRQGFEVLGWPDNPDLQQKVPSHIGVARFQQKRERETVFASIQFAPSHEWDITFNALNSKVDADNQNSNWLIFVNNDAASLGGITSIDNSIVAGSVVDGGTSAFNFINRVASTETRSLDLDINYSGENFEVHAQVGSTRAKGGTLRETSWEYGASTGYDFDLRGSTPSASTNVDATDASQFNAGWIWGGEKPTTDRENYAQFDLTFPVQAGAFTEIHTGVKYRSAKRTQDRIAYSWHGPNTLSDESLAPDWPVYLQYIFDTCPTMAACGLTQGTHSIDAVVSGNMTQQIAHNRARMEEIAFVGLNGVPADYARSLILDENWAVEEDITALYIQGDFDGENYRGNIGLRYVDTRQTSGGYEFSGDSWGFLTIDRDWLTPAELAWVEQKNNYQEILPSFNLAYDLADDTILRFGAARVMARQNWNDISTSITYGSLNVAQPTGNASNPNLKPMIADQFDLAYEWYFNPQSVLAATLFYKRIKSYRSFSTFVDQRYWEEGDQMVDVTFTRPENGPGGSTKGLELSYQQAFGEHFGVIANYTYTDAKRSEARNVSLPGSGLVEGTSDHMVNLTAYYETDLFSARLMYNYRTEWYKGLHFNGSELWNDSYGQLDASFTYNVSDNISLAFEAINLTNEQVVEYNTNKARTFSIYENGRRYVAGIRVAF